MNHCWVEAVDCVNLLFLSQGIDLTTNLGDMSVLVNGGKYPQQSLELSLPAILSQLSPLFCRATCQSSRVYFRRWRVACHTSSSVQRTWEHDEI